MAKSDTNKTDTANASSWASSNTVDQAQTDRPMSDDLKSRVEAAEKEAAEARVKAQEAADKAGRNGTPEERAAQEAAQAAVDAEAKAEAVRREARMSVEPMTVGQAGDMFGRWRPDMGAGDHLAQKFGNDPANPKIASAEHADPDKATVRLQRITPDSDTPVYTTCHPELLGDMLRAGWSKAEA